MQDAGRNDLAGHVSDELAAFGRAGGMTRRNVLRVGAVAAGAAALAGLGAGTATAAQARSTRRELSFDEGWRFFRGAVPGAEAESFDDSSWRVLDLPHDWSIEDLPGGSDDGGATADPSASAVEENPDMQVNAPARIGPFDRVESLEKWWPFPIPTGRQRAWTVNGEGWYRKGFTVDDLGDGDRVEVRFDGVYCNSDVWLNGQHLGFHPNGYTVFHYDLTPHLNRSGENVLAVRVRNIGTNTRWYAGSGIYRHTWLTVTPAVRIPQWGVGITTPDVASTQARVRTEVRVENTSGSYFAAVVRNTLFAPDGRQVARTTFGTVPIEAGAAEVVAFSQIVKNPDLWSLESPALYTARSEVLVDGQVVDEVTETFGIRSIVMNSKGFLLNGKSLKMRGANIHHDHGPLGAMALGRSEERRIQILKDAGFNAIRSSHNAPNPALLAACDRLGMLVYDECFDMWDDSKNDDDYHQHFAEWWQRDVTAWVLTGRNHPSVIIRSLGNEIGVIRPQQEVPTVNAGTEGIAARGKEMADFVRTLDPTRPVCLGGGIMDMTPLVPVPVPSQTAGPYHAGEFVEVGDVHYVADYGDRPQQYPNFAWIQSESYPSDTYNTWKLVTDNDYAVGDFVWTAWDYLGEAGLGSSWGPLDLAVGYPWYAAGCGDFDLLGQTRPQLLYRHVVWGDSPLELLVQRPGSGAEPVRWSWWDELESWTWDVPEGEAMTVRAYSIGDTVELLLNGSTVGSVTLTEADRRIATFSVPYTPGTLTAVTYRNGAEIGRKTLTTTGKPAALRLTSDVKTLTTSRDDLAHVLVEVLDAQGRPVPDAVVKVEFGLSGGELAAMGNANPHNVDSFIRPRRWTYHGQAMAYLRPPKNPGKITLNASAAGLQGTGLTINVAKATA